MAQPVKRVTVPKPVEEPETWGYPPHRTASSGKPFCRCSRRFLTRGSLPAVMVFDRGEARIRRVPVYRKRAGVLKMRRSFIEYKKSNEIIRNGAYTDVLMTS